MKENEENLKSQNIQEVEDINKLMEVRIEKLKELQQNGSNPFEINKCEVENYSLDIKSAYKEGVEMPVKIAGRIMSKRGMGKASFVDLQDGKGRIQLYVKMDLVGKSSYEEFKKYDIGDLIWVSRKRIYYSYG